MREVEERVKAVDGMDLGCSRTGERRLLGRARWRGSVACLCLASCVGRGRWGSGGLDGWSVSKRKGL